MFSNRGETLTNCGNDSDYVSADIRLIDLQRLIELGRILSSVVGANERDAVVDQQVHRSSSEPE